MSKQPLVSAVLPVYNGQRFLREAVESVLAQSYYAVELVVVDDGSTDESAAILADFSDRITVVRQANGGVAAARNRGVQEARGEFVAFLDQDDWWYPAKIERQVALCQSNGDIDLVHTGVAHFDNETRQFVGRLNPFDTPHELTGYCYERLLMGNHIYNTTVMARRSAVQRVGGFDTTIGGNTIADYDLWLRLAKQSQFAFIPDELAAFRLHGAQGTWRRREMLTAELRMLSHYVPSPMRRESPALKRRFAGLLESLGIAHLDAREHKHAREYFYRALREVPSARRLALFAAALLPVQLADWLREIRNRGRLKASRKAGPKSV